MNRPYASTLKKTPRWQTWLVSMLVVAALLGLAAWMFFIVQDGMEKGVTTFPGKRPSQRRAVSRDAEPIEFWIRIGLYSVIGVGAFGLVVWGIGVCWKPRKAGPR